MPDLTDFPALDVAIGLAFLYFLLSIVCSTINEAIATALRLRAKTLEQGIRTLLGSEEAAKKFLQSWRIRSLGSTKTTRSGEVKTRTPSYIPPRAFALAVVDTFTPDVAAKVKESDPAQKDVVDVLAEMKTTVSKIDNEVARKTLTDALDAARGSADRLREELETAFNDVMDRASGWYKRRVQVILAIIAAVVVGGMNADSFTIGDRLFKDDVLRASVTAEALKKIEEGNAKPASTANADEVKKRIDETRAVGIPLGWSKENRPDDASGWAGKAGGLLVTWFALLMGAPFWFDVLGRFAKLRGVGNRIGTPKDDDLAPSDSDARARNAQQEVVIKVESSPPAGQP